MKMPHNYRPGNVDSRSTLISSATMPPPHAEHWLTIKAESIDWAILAPNWKNLAESHAEELENLVAQSVGLDPVFSNYSWVSFYAIPALTKGGDTETVNKLKEFIRRVEVAKKTSFHTVN